MEQRKKPMITASFSYLPLEETLEIVPKKESMFIGIPREEDFPEKRVALTPNAVNVLVNNGHQIWIEHNAGAHAFYFDNDYSEAGAKICYDKKELFSAHVIIKTAPISDEEADLCQPNQMIISPIHIPTMTEESIRKLQEKKIIGIALGSIQDEAGYYPIVRSMSEIAGVYAINMASQLLGNCSGGSGILLGSVSGVPATQVVIIGAGVVAQTAARTAKGLGAQVKIYDNNIYKLMRLQRHLGQYCSTSVIDPVQLAKDLSEADVVIGALKPKNGITPLVVSEDMVSNMKAGSVIIDVSIDCGGCIETSEITTHENPTFKKYDVIHYCVPNIPSGVARTASNTISNILMPMLLECSKLGGCDGMLYHKKGLRHGVYLYKGTLTSSSIAKRLQIKHTDIDLIITSHQ
jgi:alanine dehydrogenase